MFGSTQHLKTQLKFRIEHDTKQIQINNKIKLIEQ